MWGVVLFCFVLFLTSVQSCLSIRKTTTAQAVFCYKVPTALCYLIETLWSHPLPLLLPSCLVPCFLLWGNLEGNIPFLLFLLLKQLMVVVLLVPFSCLVLEHQEPAASDGGSVLLKVWFTWGFTVPARSHVILPQAWILPTWLVPGIPFECVP